MIKTQGGIATLEGLEGSFANVISAILGIVGIVFFIMLVLGGFKFITAAGEPKALEGAKKTLTYAIAGLVFIALSYLVLRFIADFTGVTGILRFKIYQ